MKKVTVKVTPSAEPKEWSAEAFHNAAHNNARHSTDESPREQRPKADGSKTDGHPNEKPPLTKKWWFWLIIVLIVLAIVFGVLAKTGHLDRHDDIVSTTVYNEAMPKSDRPEVAAKDFKLPDESEVTQGADGKWGVYRGGELVTDYSGIASNSLGTWYLKDGLVDFSFTGYLNVNGTVYPVTKGKVDVSKPVEMSSSEEKNASPTTVTSAANGPSGEVFADGSAQQQEALASAVDYINEMAFSRDWLIAQLVSDGYRKEDATWATDHTGANWNEQAYKKAQEYLKLTSFSYQDMVEQLIFEGFTKEQAGYGAKQAGLS